MTKNIQNNYPMTFNTPNTKQGKCECMQCQVVQRESADGKEVNYFVGFALVVVLMIGIGTGSPHSRDNKVCRGERGCLAAFL